jgi:hypothetical protein
VQLLGHADAHAVQLADEEVVILAGFRVEGSGIRNDTGIEVSAECGRDWRLVALFVGQILKLTVFLKWLCFTTSPQRVIEPFQPP